ncbi:hypothetical protein [Hyphomicrobium sp.]|uniref:hypothetical protein n=1 Tax=Hyphomicrobium sp. TaxID=82 RepID=UPI001D3B9A1F|nr:hypothetical protein [Hyphomicrobium sp.]MBY0561225.1 hypothetical protein [Hyphomicrobium sp.]
MIWLTALLLAGIFGWLGTGWLAPVLLGVVAGLIVAIDSIAANEFTATTAVTLAMIIAAIFVVWGGIRALRRSLTTAG